jgi:hypothetical protein
MRKNQPLAQSFQKSGPGVRLNSRAISVDLEFATVAGSTSYSGSLYEMQPGLDTFTGLSTEMSLYDRYKINRGVWVTYTPSNAVKTTPGIIYLAADFDPNDATPPSSAALTNYEYNIRGSVNDCHEFYIPASKIHEMVKSKKVRCGPVPGDYSLYDMFNLIVATDDCTDTSDLGKLSLKTEIVPLDRQYDVTARVPRNVVELNLSTNQTIATGVDEAIDFDETVIAGFTVTNTSNGTLNLPCGAYLIDVDATFTDSANESFTACIELYQDGAAMSPPRKFCQVVTGGQANQALGTTLHSYVSSATSFTIAVMAQLSGAAGTLNANADQCRVRIRAI